MFDVFRFAWFAVRTFFGVILLTLCAYAMPVRIRRLLLPILPGGNLGIPERAGRFS
jgi:hypothetical protein